jgi:hypothetical protein
MGYLCDLLGECALLVVMIILGEHQFRVIQYGLGIGCIIGRYPILVGQLSHDLEGLLDLGLQLCSFGEVFGLFEDGLDDAEVVFVEVEGEKGVGGGEVVTRGFEGAVLADDLHRLYWVNYISDLGA